MVRISFDQKPYRKFLMQIFGAEVIPSPSKETAFGKQVLKKSPKSPGSLGIAISEAIEEAVGDSSGKTRYSLGSVLNHVMLHQTIIGLEAKAQLKLIDEKLPDVVIGCAGGGSNFAGLAFPFVLDKINGAKIEIIPRYQGNNQKVKNQLLLHGPRNHKPGSGLAGTKYHFH